MSTKIIAGRIWKGSLRLEGPTYEARESIKKVPGSRWNDPSAKMKDPSKADKYWSVPATWDSVQQLMEALGASGYTFNEDSVAEHIPDESKAFMAKVVPDTIYLDDLVIDEQAPKTSMWEHQKRGVHWIKHKRRAMLAFDMGTGKSKVTIDLLSHLAHKKQIRRVLITCPKTVGPVWPAQFDEHGWYDKFLIGKYYEGTGAKRAKQLLLTEQMLYAGLSGVSVCIINYEALLSTKLKAIIDSIEWDIIIADESHRIKAPGGATSRFMAGLKAKRRVALTGTPTPHSPLDIYAQYRFLDPSIFGTNKESFINKYASETTTIAGSAHALVGVKWRDAELAAAMGKIMFKVRASDVLDLPDVVHTATMVSLETEALRIYLQIRHQAVAHLKEEKIMTAPIILTKLLRCQQITGGWARPDEDGPDHRVSLVKREALREYLEGLPLDEPVVVFARFIHDLDTTQDISEQCDRKCYMLGSGKNELAKWQGDTTGSVLAVQIQAGGVGIDLTRARYAVYYSVGYSLGEYEQSLARLHRPGQAAKVVYHHLVARHTIDEEIYQALQKKQNVIRAIEEHLLEEDVA